MIDFLTSILQLLAFSTLTLLVGWQDGIRPVRKLSQHADRLELGANDLNISKFLFSSPHLSMLAAGKPEQLHILVPAYQHYPGILAIKQAQ